MDIDSVHIGIRRSFFFLSVMFVSVLFSAGLVAVATAFIAFNYFEGTNETAIIVNSGAWYVFILALLAGQIYGAYCALAPLREKAFRIGALNSLIILVILMMFGLLSPRAWIAANMQQAAPLLAVLTNILTLLFVPFGIPQIIGGAIARVASHRKKSRTGAPLGRLVD